MTSAVFYEVPAKNPGLIKDFYAKVLDWKYKQWGEADYWVIEAEKAKEGVSGGLYLSEKLHGVVMTYTVPDLKKAISQAEENGGKIFMETDDGQHVYIEDPEGTIFGIWEDKKE